jgi:hypothetical protein
MAERVYAHLGGIQPPGVKIKRRVKFANLRIVNKLSLEEDTNKGEVNDV